MARNQATNKRAAAVKKSLKNKHQNNHKNDRRRKSKPLFLLDENQDKVWITTATLQDIKENKAAAAKRRSKPSQQRLQLVLVPSPTTRQQIYAEAARALERLEARILPKYGERPWTVMVRIHDKEQQSPYFVWKESRLQLAVWPLLLDKIPSPPRFPGYTSSQRTTNANETRAPLAPAARADDQLADDEAIEDDDDEEEEDDLLEQETCSLSRLAYEERWRVPMPGVSIKWISPLKESFSTRKSAWEHAVLLCKQDVQIDKVLHGYSANGTPLKPARPSQRAALTAGRLRFEREGLWVVGQEETWQKERLAALASTKPASNATHVPRQLSPLAYFLFCNRKEHQIKRRRELAKSSNQRHLDLMALSAVGDEATATRKSEQTRNRQPATMQSFNLRAAERELRGIWQQLGEDERDKWATRCTSYFGRGSSGEKYDPVSPEHAETHEATPMPSGPVKFDEQNMPSLSDQTVKTFSSCPVGIASPSPPTVASATASVVTPESDCKPVGTESSASKNDLFPDSSRWRLNSQQIKACYDAGMEHFDQIMRTVTARDLVRELQDGFDLLRERGRGRYDMELPVFDSASFSFLTDLKKAPWMPIVREILGKDVVLIHKGMFLSLPGAERQIYHQDGLHLTTQYQRAVHAINVFVPLLDMTIEHGPTEFCLGSHILGNEDYDEKFLETPLVSAGTPIIFDYRLGHRGLANSSPTSRPIVYCTYARAADGKEFRDTVNFSRKRYHKIGSLVSKAPTRDERARKREQSIGGSRPLTPRDLGFRLDS